MTLESNQDPLILGHCILNTNTRALGISLWRNVVQPVFKMILEYKGEIHQYVCPEASIAGMRRWWHVKEQYDTFMFRLILRKLSKIYVEYFKSKGISRVKVIGLGLSPTCAYRYVQSEPNWGGRPREVNIEINIRIGKGVFMEELEREFIKAGINAQFLDLPPLIIYPGNRGKGLPLYPQNLIEIAKELSTFLGFNSDTVIEIFKKNAPSTSDKDLREGKNLVISWPIWYKNKSRVSELVNEGYGIIMLDNIAQNKEDEEFLATLYASQIVNQINIGQTINYWVLPDDVIFNKIKRLITEQLGYEALNKLKPL